MHTVTSIRIFDVHTVTSIKNLDLSYFRGANQSKLSPSLQRGFFDVRFWPLAACHFSRFLTI